MQQFNKKMAVFKALENQTDSVSLSQLLKIVGVPLPERTIRRWLNEMANERLIEKTGKKRGTRYQIIKRTQNIAQNEPGSLPSSDQQADQKNPHFIFSSESKEAITYIQQPIFQRKPVPYYSAWLNNYQPNKTFYLTHAERKKLFARGQPNISDAPAGTYARKIYNRLLIDLSYNSSRLEGNTYSLLDTEKLVIEGIDNSAKLDEERIMILNHKDAIRYLVDNASKLKISYDEICTLHYLLSDGLVPANYAGKMRDHAVRIGASAYLTLENPIKLKHELHLICQKTSRIIDPYEQSFFLLAHLAYLQAFTDVNKRTSRLSANIPLIQHNLYPLSFNDIEKNDYISAMIGIYELNETRPLAELYVFSYLRTCQQYDATSEAIGFDEIRVRFRTQRRELIRNIIIRNLSGKKLYDYVQSQTFKFISQDARNDFIEDVYEDLKEINSSRIAGLGITKQQLNKWRKIF